MLGVMCLVALLHLVRLFLLVLSVLEFFAHRLCVLTTAKYISKVSPINQ